LGTWNRKFLAWTVAPRRLNPLFSRRSVNRKYGPRASRITVAGPHAWRSHKPRGAATSTIVSTMRNGPEPELTVLLSPSGKLIGYTIGNDMSSRDIEGENPLYLPQAKVYDRSCALGPCILATSEPLPLETRIALEIVRDGEVVFSDEP